MNDSLGDAVAAQQSPPTEAVDLVQDVAPGDRSQEVSAAGPTAHWPSPEFTEALDSFGQPRQQRFGWSEAAQAVGGGLMRTDGRAARSEYWWGSALLAAVWAPIALALALLTTSSSLIVMAAAALGLFIFVPFVVILEGLRAARRLHDADLAGWWVALALVPFGVVAVLWLLIRPGTRGVNRFGPMSQPGLDRSEALSA